MYLRFTFRDGHMPKEFGDDGNNSVYYNSGVKVCTRGKGKDKCFLGSFSKVNLFVGANNSGKSRFLRGLLKSDSQMFEISSSEENIEHWKKVYQKWISEELSSLMGLHNKTGNEVASIMHEVNRLQDPYSKVMSNPDSYITSLNSILSKEILDISEIKRNTGGQMRPSADSSSRIHALFKKLELFKILKSFQNEIKFAIDNQPQNRIYVPILRSINRSSKIDRRTFLEVVEELYDLNNQNYQIFTGLNLFDEILNVRNDLKEKREGFEKFELFLSKYFFEGKTVEIISNLNEKVIRIYVDGEERKIHNVGDGIQALILLLFPIYTAEKNTWIFIEEPETHLHPGLQRIFIETLLNDEFLDSKGLRYFFTTHSNHFLDLTIKMDTMAIFQFEKNQADNYEIKTNVKPDISILDILGVNSSSVFLANTSIWIEGPTDRKYVSKWLKLYIENKKDKKYLKEDIDFAFFEYGGNLIAHYLFDNKQEDIDYEKVRDKINAFSLSNKIILFADDDNTKGSSKKGERRKKLKDLSEDKFKYLNTAVVEIENLLPVEVVKGFSKCLVTEKYHAKLESIDFRKEEYARERLGQYFEDKFNVVKIPKSGQRAFKADSGTLKNAYKIKLCNYFLEYDLKYDGLVSNNKVLEEIIQELYVFINK